MRLITAAIETMTSIDNPLPILVVDDNSVDQHLVASHLGKIGSWKREVKLDFAADGKEALGKLYSKPFELVVLDWELPLLGKGEVLRHLRKNNYPIPVVVISGVSHHHISAQLNALAAPFLSKDHMAPDTFHSAISQALVRHNLDPSDFFITQDHTSEEVTSEPIRSQLP